MDLETPRLRLRRWRDEDLEPFAALNADPEVMEYFPSPLLPEETRALVERARAHFAKHGFGPWAVELRGQTSFIGFVGLSVPDFETSFTPCVEIGWRLARAWWGKGLATEGAQAAMTYGFECLGLSEIVAFTVPGNTRSRRVMEKLGMRYSEDFDHPKLEPGHPLRRHALYCARP